MTHPHLSDPRRLEVLEGTQLMDSPAEATFDRVTRLAAKILRVPMALVSFVDDRRQFFKSAVGLGEPWSTARQTPLSHSFCQHAVSTAEALLVSDARHDARVQNNLAIRDLGVIAYAGVPIFAHRQALGALCVIDTAPRLWAEEEVDLLRELAGALVMEIELRASLRSVADAATTLRSAFDATPLAVAMRDLDGKIVYSNPALQSLLGYSDEELRALPVEQHGHPDEVEGEVRAFWQLLRGRIERHQADRRARRKDGSWVWVRSSAGLVRDALGRPHFTISMAEDLTEPKRMADALRHSEEQLRLTFEHAPIGKALVSLDGKFLRVNRALCEIVGYAREDLLQRTFQELTPSGDEEELALVGKLLEGSISTYQLSKRYIHSDGHFVEVQLYVSLIRDELGSPVHFIAQIQDVTEKNRIERELRARNAAVLLLQSITTAANESETSQEAISRTLALLCDHGDWSIGHAVLVHDTHTSDLWRGRDPEQLAALRASSADLALDSAHSLLGRVLREARPVWIEDVAPQGSSVHAALGFPVLADAEVVALMELYQDRPLPPDSAMLDILPNVGTQLGRVIERERHAHVVRELAMRDELTGLFNRRGFLEIGSKQLDEATRAGQSVVVIFGDLNGLKAINDRFGHEEGDQALRDAAHVLRKGFRGSDVVARLGGDEFVALTTTAPGEPTALLRRLREQIEDFNRTQKRSYRLSVSTGVVRSNPAQPTSLEALLAIADAEMYEQKRSRPSRAPR